MNVFKLPEALSASGRTSHSLCPGDWNPPARQWAPCCTGFADGLRSQRLEHNNWCCQDTFYFYYFRCKLSAKHSKCKCWFISNRNTIDINFFAVGNYTGCFRLSPESWPAPHRTAASLFGCCRICLTRITIAIAHIWIPLYHMWLHLVFTAALCGIMHTLVITFDRWPVDEQTRAQRG